MRKVGQDEWGWSRSGQQSWWRKAIFSDGRLYCGPRVLRCDVRELRRKRFSRGKMRHSSDPVRGSSRVRFGYERAYNFTGCRRMKVPF